MSEIKLFKIKNKIEEMVSSEVLLEKELQTLIEENMEKFFGIRFLKSEYVITNGRIDSIGIDENNCPVILEYKRSSNENVINQGLFYLDWLLDHKADFKLLVIEQMSKEIADLIDWSVPCVICIASEFTKYDIHAVNQMQRNIKLVKYRKYDDELILFEHLNTPVVKSFNTDIAGEKFCPSLLAVLPYLLDGHVVRINAVDHASGEVVIGIQIVLLDLGAPMAVVKAHDIAVGQNHTGVLLILPVEFSVSHGLEEILLHIFRPAGGISQNPVELSGLKITVDDNVLMTSGEGQRVGLLVVPYGIVVEPVVGVLTSGSSHRIYGQYILVIPLLQNLSRLPVHQHTGILYSTTGKVLSQD